MTTEIEFEDLQKIYNDETIEDIVNYWQNDIFTHPILCTEHKRVVLKYVKGQLYCPEPGCQYHQHWIPIAIVDYWNEMKPE